MIKSKIEIQYVPGSGGEHLYWLLSMTGQIEWDNTHKFENILTKKDFVKKIVYNDLRPYNWNKDRDKHSHVYFTNISFIHDAGLWRLHCGDDWKILRIVPNNIDLVYANIVSKAKGPKNTITKSTLEYHVKILKTMYACIPKNNVTYSFNFTDLIKCPYELYENICTFLNITASKMVYNDWIDIHNRWKHLTKISLENHGFIKEAKQFL
jgi:hypothetical protein